MKPKYTYKVVVQIEREWLAEDDLPEGEEFSEPYELGSFKTPEDAHKLVDTLLKAAHPTP